MSVSPESPVLRSESRQLPTQVDVPGIRGEMVRLRPATIADLDRLDALDAFYNASGITGKDRHAERAIVRTWVRRSVAWSQGLASEESGVGDPEARRTVAWAMLRHDEHDTQHQANAVGDDGVIGMIFLIDIDGWSRSARIQVILGKDYRGRGYSRDAMPRVMTYGFAAEPIGLGLHRIWVSVPEKNTRSLSVYQSLGFVPSGTARDGLWDAEVGKYQDLVVMDTLVDEYDPIRSLDAFGMHVFEENPGVREALSAREHSLAIRQTGALQESLGENHGGDGDGHRHGSGSSQGTRFASGPSWGEAGGGDNPQRADDRDSAVVDGGGSDGSVVSPPSTRSDDEVSDWPFVSQERRGSKDAWWRNLGRGRTRGSEGKQ